MVKRWRAKALLSLAGVCAGMVACNAQAQYVLDDKFPAKGFTFQEVSWLTVAPDGKSVYLLQRGTPAVSVWSPDGLPQQWWKTTALGDPHSLRFQRLRVGGDRVWITDMAPPLLAGSRYGHCVKEFSLAGKFVRSIGTCGKNSEGSGLNPVQFDKITDIAFDSLGMFWISDGDLGGLNNRVLQLDGSGKVLQNWSAPNNQAGSGPGEFNLPHALDIDHCDRVFVADTLNHRIQVIRTDGTFLQQLQCFATDGVYGARVTRPTRNGRAQLFTTSSPTTSPTGGTVRIFDVAKSCTASKPVPDGCKTADQWDITLPPAPSAAMLHMIDVARDGEVLYIATLGGNLPPQRWIRVAPPSSPKKH